MTPSATAIPAVTADRGRLPVVAIVGRPNVGKSTLFNRLIRQRKAVVDDTPGVTRDRNFATATWRGLPFILVDTGGIDPSETEGVLGQVQEQTKLAIREADLVIFLFDGREGINPADADAVGLLRRSGKPVVFAVNKIDSDKQGAAVADFFTLGLDTVFPISAAHGRGVADLMDTVCDSWRKAAAEQEPPAPEEAQAAAGQESAALRVAIVGRPNVGSPRYSIA